MTNGDAAATLIRHLSPWVDAAEKPTGVMVGVYKGRDSSVLLERFPNLHLYLVDDWSLNGCPNLADPGEVFMAARSALEKYGSRYTWIHTESTRAALMFGNFWNKGGHSARPDFVYIDADHEEASVRDDIEAWYELVRPGGLLAGHDYGHEYFPGVKRAVDGIFGDRVRVEGTVWMVRA